MACYFVVIKDCYFLGIPAGVIMWLYFLLLNQSTALSCVPLCRRNLWIHCDLLLRICLHTKLCYTPISYIFTSKHVKYNKYMKTCYMRHIHFNIVCDSAAVAQMAQMYIWLCKHNGRHLCRTVQLTGCMPSMGAITVQADSGVPCGEAIQTGQEGNWTTLASAYHITSYHRPYHITISHHIISHIISYILSHHIYHIIYHITSYHITSHHIIYHIISYIISQHIIYHIISYHIISYHITSYHITSHHITSYHISHHISYNDTVNAHC